MPSIQEQAQWLRMLWGGFWSSRIIITANNLQIFDHLTEPKPAPVLAALIKSDPRATEVLLDALVALQLLKKRQNQFVNAPLSAKFLVSGTPHYQGDILKHADNLWNSWSQLDNVVKTGKPASKIAFDHHAFIMGMHNIAGLVVCRSCSGNSVWLLSLVPAGKYSGFICWSRFGNFGWLMSPCSAGNYSRPDPLRRSIFPGSSRRRFLFRGVFPHRSPPSSCPPCGGAAVVRARASNHPWGKTCGSVVLSGSRGSCGPAIPRMNAAASVGFHLHNDGGLKSAPKRNQSQNYYQYCLIKITVYQLHLEFLVQVYYK